MIIECERCLKEYDIRIRRRPRNGSVEVACPWCDLIIILMFRKYHLVPLLLEEPAFQTKESWKIDGF